MEAEHVSGKGIPWPEKRSACPGERGRPAPGRLRLGDLSEVRLGLFIRTVLGGSGARLRNLNFMRSRRVIVRNVGEGISPRGR